MKPNVTDSQKLDGAVRAALGLPAASDLTNLAYGGAVGWDSVAHLHLVLAIEEAFGISLEGEDVMALASYQSLRSVLRDRHGLAIE